MNDGVLLFAIALLSVGIYEAGRRRPFYFINDIKIEGAQEVKGWYTVHLPGTSTKNGAIFVLPKRTTNIVIDAHGNDPPFRGGSRQAIKNDQHIALEGRFGDYFDVYAVKTQHIFALSILTPDVMDTIMSCATKFDIEMKDNTLLIGSKKSVRDESVRQEIEKVAAALLPEVLHQLKTQDEEEITPLSNMYLETLDSKWVRFGRRKFAKLNLMLALLGIVALWGIYVVLFV